jgi:gamma-tubulin complex component 2
MTNYRSLKHYFLLDQSDFMVHFMDLAEDEIQKNYKDIRLNKLESLLEISLRITSANSDPFKDDLKVKLCNSDLISMVKKIQDIETKNGITKIIFN